MILSKHYHRPVTPSTQQDEEPQALHEHAIDNLRFIREAMERAGTFTAVPGYALILTGLSALLATAAAAAQPTPARWILVWILEAGIAVLIGGAGIILKARRLDFALRSAVARRFALALVPPILAGILLTWVFYRAGLAAEIPALWLVSYGTAVITGGALSVRIVPVMGLCYAVLGSAAFFFPSGWNDVLMATSFGGLQILFGVLIARNYGG